MDSGLQGSFDSAGTGAWHIGNPPDPRSIDIAAQNGVDISGQRARQIAAEDFARFDLICAMDASNLSNLQQIKSRQPAGSAGAKLSLLLDFAPGYEGADIPDPYYGGDDGFAHVWRLIALAMPGVLAAARSR